MQNQSHNIDFFLLPTHYKRLRESLISEGPLSPSELQSRIISLSNQLTGDGRAISKIYTWFESKQKSEKNLSLSDVKQEVSTQKVVKKLEDPDTLIRIKLVLGTIGCINTLTWENTENLIAHLVKETGYSQEWFRSNLKSIREDLKHKAKEQKKTLFWFDHPVDLLCEESNPNAPEKFGVIEEQEEDVPEIEVPEMILEVKKPGFLTKKKKEKKPLERISLDMESDEEKETKKLNVQVKSVVPTEDKVTMISPTSQGVSTNVFKIPKKTAPVLQPGVTAPIQNEVASVDQSLKEKLRIQMKEKEKKLRQEAQQAQMAKPIPPKPVDPTLPRPDPKNRRVSFPNSKDLLVKIHNLDDTQDHFDARKSIIPNPNGNNNVKPDLHLDLVVDFPEVIVRDDGKIIHENLSPRLLTQKPAEIEHPIQGENIHEETFKVSEPVFPVKRKNEFEDSEQKKFPTIEQIQQTVPQQPVFFAYLEDEGPDHSQICTVKLSIDSVQHDCKVFSHETCLWVLDLLKDTKILEATLKPIQFIDTMRYEKVLILHGSSLHSKVLKPKLAKGITDKDSTSQVYVWTSKDGRLDLAFMPIPIIERLGLGLATDFKGYDFAIVAGEIAQKNIPKKSNTPSFDMTIIDD